MKFICGLIALTSLFASSLGLAESSLPKSLSFVQGGADAGGGDAIVCTQDGKETAYFADTFELARAGKFKGIEKTDPQAIMEAVVQVIEKNSPEKVYDHPFYPGQYPKVSLAWIIRYTHAFLHFDYADDLPELDDDNIDVSKLPANCRKQQFAVQDIKKGIVYQNMNLGFQMSLAERGLFELHETLIALRNAPGYDTTPIRKEVAKLLADPKYSLRNIVKNMNLRDPKPYRAGDIPRTWEFWYVGKYCASDTRLGGHTSGDSALSNFCDTVRKRFNKQVDEYYREAQLPVLMTIPKTLNCRVMREDNNPDGIVATNFTLKNTKGDRTELAWKTEPNGYSIKFAPGSTITDNPDSTQVWFSTHEFDREQAGEHGQLKIEMLWGGYEDKNRVVVSLGKYFSQIDQFIGYLSVGEAYYRISCVANDIEFGLKRK